MYKLLILAFLLISFYGKCQSFDLGSWSVINLNYNIDKKWSVFGEGQLRSLKFYNNFHYYEYKGGVNLKISNSLRFTIGAGIYQTYKEGGNFIPPKNNDEFRLWPQVILLQSLGKLKVEQRYRSEFRFTSDGYRNRFRYRFGVAYPFGKERDDYKPYQIGMSNEIFFTDKEPYFERNRLQLSCTIKPSKTTSIQLGYLHQFDYKINDETGRDFLQFGYFVELFHK